AIGRLCRLGFSTGPAISSLPTAPTQRCRKGSISSKCHSGTGQMPGPLTQLEFPSGKLTIPGMTASTLRVRRATVEDLETLRPLWTSMHLPVAELEPRLTEFQVVENAEGEVMGGIGFEITERQGRLHSEGFTDFAIA